MINQWHLQSQCPLTTVSFDKQGDLSSLGPCTTLHSKCRGDQRSIRCPCPHRTASSYDRQLTGDHCPRDIDSSNQPWTITSQWRHNYKWCNHFISVYNILRYHICWISNKNILSYYLRYRVAKLFDHPSYWHIANNYSQWAIYQHHSINLFAIFQETT